MIHRPGMALQFHLFLFPARPASAQRRSVDNNMSILDIFSFLASISTAIGVSVTAYQIRIARIGAIRQFEDGFAKEYRELANRIPTDALLGLEFTEAQKATHFDELYRYFDLCNEQIFLRQKDRIRKQTWIFWSDGMRSNFNKHAFKWAWEKIERVNTTDFSELRRLYDSDFRDDPREWK